MITRIRKRLEEKEEGFTLIELLVVIIIIGILAAIAIPLYLNQQQKASDAALKSDLKDAQIKVASSLVDDQTGTEAEALLDDTDIGLSPNVTLTSPALDLTADPPTFEICGTVSSGTAEGQAGFCIDESGNLEPQAAAPAA